MIIGAGSLSFNVNLVVSCVNSLATPYLNRRLLPETKTGLFSGSQAALLLHVELLSKNCVSFRHLEQETLSSLGYRLFPVGM
jgi:hypothetical protein